jgi:amino acid transporter
MADSRPVVSELSRDLRLVHVTMMGLGMMIGAGVFVGIGIAVRGAGTGGLLLTMALNGLVALFSAMSFAELSSAIPRAGGVYNFARIGFGRSVSFLAGWVEWLAASAAGGLYAVVFASFTVRYCSALMGLGLSPAVESAAVRAVALLAAGLFIFINYRGSSETGKVGVLFTAGQMLFVLFIAVMGLIVTVREPSRLANFQPFLPQGWWKLLGTMGVIYVAFEGFEVIAQAGDETVDPKRNIPKAMLYAVLVVTLTYLGVAFAAVVAIRGAGDVQGWFAAQPSDIAGFAEAVERLTPWPGAGGLLVTLAVIFSSTSALNATIYSATRASYALGRDRMLPPALAGISPKRRTPHVALASTSVLVLLVALVLEAEDAAATASMMFLFLFLLVNLSVIRIRLNMGDELDYGYLMPLFPLVPLLAIACQVALAGGIVSESLPAAIVGGVWVAGGAATYLLYSRSHVTAAEGEIHVLEERRAPARGEYRIMVAVANPDNALDLVQNTYKLCGAKAAHVELIHMVPVPPQVPLTDAHRYMLAGREGIQEALLSLGLQFPVSTTFRYCRNAARGIVSAVRERRVNMLLLGWHGRRRHRTFALGSTIDPVIERSPCNVVVLKDCGGNRTFRRVLVPVAGGPHGAFALEVAHILADPAAGRIDALTVERGPRPQFDVAAFVREQAVRLDIPPGRIRARTVHAQDVVGTILRQAEGFDLVVVGCTAEPFLRLVARHPVPETIAQRCDKPLVMVKAAAGIRSWIKRWI